MRSLTILLLRFFVLKLKFLARLSVCCRQSTKTGSQKRPQPVELLQQCREAFDLGASTTKAYLPLPPEGTGILQNLSQHLPRRGHQLMADSQC